MGMKIAKIAMEALGKLQSMPKGGKAAMLVGAGALLGGLAVDLMVGDTFKKQSAVNPEPQKESEFEYVPPTIGKDGIAKADTTMYAGTQKIKRISYFDKDGNMKHMTDYDKNGKLEEFRICSGNGYTDYDNTGNWLRYSSVETNNGITNDLFIDQTGIYMLDSYDSKDRIVHREYELDDGMFFEDYKYSSDGSYVVETKDVLGNLKKKVSYDKSGNVMQEKTYEDDGQLKYTVKPKYNKEGDIVKRDTIPNS